MSLLDQIKQDLIDFTTNTDLFDPNLIKFTSSDGSQTATIAGRSAKIGLAVDTDGNAVNSKKAYISFCEDVLTAKGYTVRNQNQEVFLNGHKIDVADSTGIVKHYKIQTVIPDETVGLIMCILVDYKP